MLSVLVEFSMFPTSSDGREGGASVSKSVSKIIDAIDKSGVPYQLTPMGTVIEAKSMREALDVIALAYEQVSDCERVYSSLKFDIRHNTENRLKTKIDSVEKVLGRAVSH
ncbi:MAG TPA: MTH1187 family thiamine-binding protein [Sulfurimonas sp.]|nr:MTH1187 family thiamine-binding protein [Sulfurimonas sp.]